MAENNIIRYYIHLNKKVDIENIVNALNILSESTNCIYIHYTTLKSLTSVSQIQNKLHKNFNWNWLIIQIIINSRRAKQFYHDSGIYLPKPIKSQLKGINTLIDCFSVFLQYNLLNTSNNILCRKSKEIARADVMCKIVMKGKFEKEIKSHKNK